MEDRHKGGDSDDGPWHGMAGPKCAFVRSFGGSFVCGFRPSSLVINALNSVLPARLVVGR